MRYRDTGRYRDKQEGTKIYIGGNRDIRKGTDINRKGQR